MLAEERRANSFSLVNPRATQNLNESLVSNTPTFNSSDVITVFAIEARNENAL